jgi:hypothetical protein
MWGRKPTQGFRFEKWGLLRLTANLSTNLNLAHPGTGLKPDDFRQQHQ